MKVKFLQKVDIYGQFDINEGDTFMAFRNHDDNTIHIMMEDGKAIIVSSDKINGILKIIEED